ncbi:unnamed protein product [Anisakis simplex]|uniref:HIG1 domain-containing protein n=1 Tax=Anisakis simplex TaxID=6269 RepID=A0A0M3K4M5_ANISI|nr:unnamed protein product [Anisakis simplex]
MAIGMATGISAGFLVLILLYTIVGFATLQVYLKKGNADTLTNVYQLSYLIGVVFSQGLVYALFSVDASDAE